MDKVKSNTWIIHFYRILVHRLGAAPDIRDPNLYGSLGMVVNG